MSIWSSVGPDVQVIDLHADSTDQYAGTGVEGPYVDVALTGHHDMIRLAVYGKGIDTCLMMPADVAERLAANLMTAVGERSSRVPEFRTSPPCPEDDQHG